MKYYAISKGRKTGIFLTWDECQKYIKGFSGAIYKSFTNIDDANNFLNLEQSKNQLYHEPIDNSCDKPNIERKNEIKPKKIELENIPTHSICIYTDGSYNTKTKKGAWGYYCDSLNIYEVEETEDVTNNYNELYAIKMGILGVLKTLTTTLTQNKIVVVSDSLYAISCICDYYQNWINEGILKEKSNWELIEEIYMLSEKYDINFSHIKSHQNLSKILMETTPKKRHSYIHYKNNDYIDKLVQNITKN
jgi:viroplasmin and RNaseH domain-containing protein